MHRHGVIDRGLQENLASTTPTTRPTILPRIPSADRGPSHSAHPGEPMGRKVHDPRRREWSHAGRSHWLDETEHRRPNLHDGRLVAVRPVKRAGDLHDVDLSRGRLAVVGFDDGQIARFQVRGEGVIRNRERDRRTPGYNNLLGIRHALEAAGVEFIPENGGGAGVRLRKRD